MKTVWIVNQYASTPETGIGGRNYYIGRELAKQGYNVYLIASSTHHLLREKKKIQERFETDKLSDNFHFVWVDMPSYGEAHSKKRVLNWFVFSWRIQKLPRLISNKPDVVLCSSPSLVSFLGAKSLAKKFKARLVFEVRDIWPLTLTEIGGYSPRHPFIRFLQWVEDKAYRESNAVVSNLKNSVEHMVSRGMDPTKFSWVPNGFSLDEVSESYSLDQETLEKLPKNKFLIGYTGTFGLANDLYTLIEAAEILKSNSAINFVLVGGGKDKQSILDYVSLKKLDNIVIIDYIKKQQIQSMLSMFDVLAVGAKKEPMYRYGVSPNKLFDYMYAAKPIVYHIESGDYTPVKSANAGYEVEPGNPVALADAVLKLYQMSTAERSLLGENGRKAAFEQYDYQTLAVKMAHILFPD